MSEFIQARLGVDWTANKVTDRLYEIASDLAKLADNDADALVSSPGETAKLDRAAVLVAIECVQRYATIKGMCS